MNVTLAPAPSPIDVLVTAWARYDEALDALLRFRQTTMVGGKVPAGHRVAMRRLALSYRAASDAVEGLPEIVSCTGCDAPFAEDDADAATCGPFRSVPNFCSTECHALSCGAPDCWS